MKDGDIELRRRLQNQLGNLAHTMEALGVAKFAIVVDAAGKRRLEEVFHDILSMGNAGVPQELKAIGGVPVKEINRFSEGVERATSARGET